MTEFFETDSCRIAYRVEAEAGGEGEPIFALHGFGLTQSSMRGLVRKFSKDHRVIALDWRGHGQTENPAQDDAFSYALMRDDLRGLMDHLGIESAHLVGHSMGGQIGLMLAISNPGRVKSLTLIAGGPCRQVTDPQEKKTWLRAADRFANAPQETVIAALASSTPLVAPEQRDLDPSALYSAARGPDLARMIRGAFLNVETNDDACKGLEVPLLCLVGERDAGYLGEARRLHELVRDSRLVLVPEAGHLVHLERADEVLNTVEKFWETCKSAKPA